MKSYHEHVRRLALLAIIVSGVVAGAAQAQDIPDLTGTWTGRGIGVAIGPNPHASGTTGTTFPEVDFTVVIERQQDRRFVGSIASGERKEVIAGVIAPDLDEGVMVDEDGYYDFEIDDANTLELCYQHNTPDSRLAACYRLTRSE